MLPTLYNMAKHLANNWRVAGPQDSFNCLVSCFNKFRLATFKVRLAVKNRLYICKLREQHLERKHSFLKCFTKFLRIPMRNI